MSSALRIVGSLLLSAVFLYLAARGVSWEEVWEALRAAHLVYVVPMALSTIVPLAFRALRWGVLVAPIRRVRFRALFAATAIGFTANLLLPLRAGEIARPWVLARMEPIRFSQAMATVAVERLFDMAVLLLMFGVATLMLPLPSEWRRYGWFFLAVFLVLFAMLFVLRRHPETLLRIVEPLLRPLPERISHRLLDLVRGFVEGLESLGSARAVALAGLHSIAVWLTMSLSFGYGLSAMGLDVPWVGGALATTTFTAIAVSIPGGPGFIGMFQMGCVVALDVFGVEKSAAFSYSVLTHLVQFATTVAVGLYYFTREGLRLRELRDISRADAVASEEPQRANVGAGR